MKEKCALFTGIFWCVWSLLFSVWAAVPVQEQEGKAEDSQNNKSAFQSTATEIESKHKSKKDTKDTEPEKELDQESRDKLAYKEAQDDQNWLYSSWEEKQEYLKNAVQTGLGIDLDQYRVDGGPNDMGSLLQRAGWEEIDTPVFGFEPKSYDIQMATSIVGRDISKVYLPDPSGDGGKWFSSTWGLGSDIASGVTSFITGPLIAEAGAAIGGATIGSIGNLPGAAIGAIVGAVGAAFLNAIIVEPRVGLNVTGYDYAYDKVFSFDRVYRYAGNKK